MKEEKQLLKDFNIIPTNEIIAEAIGDANEAYLQFIYNLKECGITLMDWRYYNDGKAWLSKGEYKWTTARGTNKVKTIFWLSIWEGFFKISFYFSHSSIDKLLNLPISQEVKQSILTAKTMEKTLRLVPLIINVENLSQLKDIYLIANFKIVEK